MPRLFRLPCRNSLLLILALLLGGGAASAQKSDGELLRESRVDAETWRGEERYAYGLQAGKRTIDPFYHLFSSTFYVWQNFLKDDVASQGGYAVSNPEYFKELYERYGLLRSLFFGVDRAMRNTKVGRVGYERFLRDDRGLIIDTTERYAR